MYINYMQTDDTQLPSTEDSVVTVSTGGQVKQVKKPISVHMHGMLYSL